jgi:hypothetical protein
VVPESPGAHSRHPRQPPLRFYGAVLKWNGTSSRTHGIGTAIRRRGRHGGLLRALAESAHICVAVHLGSPSLYFIPFGRVRTNARVLQHVLEHKAQVHSVGD